MKKIESLIQQFAHLLLLLLLLCPNTDGKGAAAAASADAEVGVSSERGVKWEIRVVREGEDDDCNIIIIHWSALQRQRVGKV